MHTAYQLPTASFHTVAKNPRLPHQSTTTKSVYCSGSHASSLYNIISDSEKCLEVIKQQRLCFNCLDCLKISQCTSKYHCQNCRRKHHTSLCTEKSATNNTTSQSNQTISVAQATSIRSQPSLQTNRIQNSILQEIIHVFSKLLLPLSQPPLAKQLPIYVLHLYSCHWQMRCASNLTKQTKFSYLYFELIVLSFTP